MSDSPSLLARAHPFRGHYFIGSWCGHFSVLFAIAKPCRYQTFGAFARARNAKACACAPVAEVNAVDAPVPQTQSLPTTPVAVAVQRTDLFADAAAIWAALQGALTPKIAALLLPEEFVRKFTIAVYGLSEGRVVAQNRPYVAPEGLFAVAKLSDGPQAQFRLLPQNADRYDAYLDALRWANSDAGMALYERAYPQLQAAFEELGLGKRSFHQIAIIAIDNLLCGS